MLKSWFVGLVILSGLAAEGRAGGFINGHQLLEMCTDESAQQVCLAYVAGVFDQLDVPGNNIGGITLCIPPSKNISQLKDVVIEFLRKNPEMRQYVAATSVDVAWRWAYPCGH